MIKAFGGTDFNYAVGPSDEVFLTKGVSIQTNLLVTVDTTKKNRRADRVEIEEDQSQASKIQIAALENKLYQIGVNSANNGSPNALITGYVRDAKTGRIDSGRFYLY